MKNKIKHPFIGITLGIITCLMLTGKFGVSFSIPQAHAIEGTLTVSSTTTTTSGNTYGNIFYDNDNNSYFMDPAATVGSLVLNGPASIATTNLTQALNVAGNIGFTGGPKIIDSTGKLQLQAGGSTTGANGNSSIYFLDSAGSTMGRFDASYTPSPAIGTGADGAVIITSSVNCFTTAIAAGRSSGDCIATNITAFTNLTNRISVTSTTGFAAGDEVAIMQTTGVGAGNYETRIISSVADSTTLVLTDQIAKIYAATGAQVVRVPNYTNVTVCGGNTGGGCTAAGTLTTKAWDGTTGGVIFFRATGTVLVNSGGTITAIALGGAGGAAGALGTGGGGGAACSDDNKTHSGQSGQDGSSGGTAGGPFPGGAGGGSAASGAGDEGGGGSGGGYATGSTTAAIGSGTNGGTAGAGGTASGSLNFISQLFLGSGGGGGGGGAGGGGGTTAANCTGTGGGDGGDGGNGGAGGAGGGIIIITATTLTNSGTITAAGAAGTIGSSGTNGQSKGCIGCHGGGGGGSGGGGGGGSGGAIWLRATTLTAGTTNITGGTADTNTSLGGNGGNAGPNVNGGGGGCRGGSGGAGGSGGSNGATCTTSPPDGTATAGSTGQLTTGTLPSTTYGTLYMGTSNVVASDIAEYYPATETLKPGDVVSLDKNSPRSVSASPGPYDGRLLGIVSTNPGATLGGGPEEIASNQTLVALAGRVPVKIDPASDPIQIGDFITSSTIPGYAMRATGAGMVVARALESWRPTNAKTKIDVFVRPTYYIGDISPNGAFQSLSVESLTVTNTLTGSDAIRGATKFTAGAGSMWVNRSWDLTPKIINLLPSYNTTTYVTNISTNGFMINMGTPPTKEEKVYWQALW